MQTQALFSGAQIGIINIQTLVLPGASAPSDSKADCNGKKRRRLIIESPRRKRRTIFLQTCSSMRHFIQKELIVCSVNSNNNIRVVSLTASVQLFVQWLNEFFFAGLRSLK